jgi:colanic acid/amylovoran biosynthesis glycosyltransferase
MPTASSLTIKNKMGLKYSMGAHAFDIFQNSGDLFLSLKLINCTFIHTSTISGVSRLKKKLFSFNKKLKLIRRGLVNLTLNLN